MTGKIYINSDFVLPTQYFFDNFRISLKDTKNKKVFLGPEMAKKLLNLFCQSAREMKNPRSSRRPRSFSAGNSKAEIVKIIKNRFFATFISNKKHNFNEGLLKRWYL